MSGSSEFTDVAAGKVATIVTHLEMLTRPAVMETVFPEGFTLRYIQDPYADWYRDLYRRVGEDWLWSSRIEMSHTDLEDIIRHPNVDVYALSYNGRDEGLLELDFRIKGECELAFLGLTADFTGKGIGRPLINTGTRLAWEKPIHRLWVHTCTLDHPGALRFYQHCGFRVFRREIEVFDDPRLTGVLSRDAARHIPIIE